MNAAYYYRDPGQHRATGRGIPAIGERSVRAQDIWRDGSSISKTSAEMYLRSRDLLPDTLLYPDSGDGWPETLRYSCDLTRSPNPPCYCGLMVAVNDAQTGLVVAIHRIPLHGDGRPYLRPDGSKLKLSLGSIVGNAFRGSCWPDPDGRWGIIEGIEKALAATQLMRLPVWSAISAGNMAHVNPPSWARSAYIFADNDQNGIGQKAARQTLIHLRAVRSIESIRVLMADAPGADMSDVLTEAAYAQ